MKPYNNGKQSKYIAYLDANNFLRLDNESVSSLLWIQMVKTKMNWLVDVNSISKNILHGYILDADLEYPYELHGLHNDFPLVPAKVEIVCSMLPRSCNDIANQYGIKVGGVNKLVPNLDNESKYILHYRNHQLTLSLGMKLIGVHRV